MNENAEPRKIETETCSRCGGTGHYSYNQITGTVCFKCSGGKVVYTKRGRAAHDFLVSLRSKPASQFKVGELIQTRFGSREVLAFAKVLSSGFGTDGSGYVVDGATKPYWVITVNHAKYGAQAMHTFPDVMIRKGCTAEEKQATLKQALDFQDTLGKNGKPSRKALKAVQDRVAAEVVDKVLAEETRVCAATPA